MRPWRRCRGDADRVTGPDGFVAWHVRCAARARWGDDLIPVREAEFDDPSLMDAALGQVDVVIHLAGVNRAHDPAEIARVNPWLAEQLTASMDRTGRRIPVVYGNSIHALGDSVFGVSKRNAADILRAGTDLVDVVMPNIFGEHGVPNYNSVVATFCHALAAGETPQVVDDKELPLVHVGTIADLLLDQAVSPRRVGSRFRGGPRW